MLIIKTVTVDSEDLDIILAEDLVDREGNFYNLTLGQALQEETRGESLVYVEYDIDNLCLRLHNFIGWTDSRVIFNITGIGVQDTLLTSVLRNPPDGV